MGRLSGMDRSPSLAAARSGRAASELESLLVGTSALVHWLSVDRSWRARRRQRRARLKRRARVLMLTLLMAIAMLLRSSVIALWWVGARLLQRVGVRHEASSLRRASSPVLTAPPPAAERAVSTTHWLERERTRLPLAAQAPLQRVEERAQNLTSQLRGAAEQQSVQVELRRLIDEELAELVYTYQKLPTHLTALASDGRESPDHQLLAGIAIVDRGLLRLQERVAQQDLRALSTQVRYLTLKYAPDEDL